MSKSLKSQGMRRCRHESSYFQGRYNKYGRYQWDIKYYDFQNEFEIETALFWAFGDYVKVGVNPVNGNTIRGFDGLSELLGRPIESGTAGRSGGWLVIDTELTPAELKKVDAHVEACMNGLSDFLRDEREFQASEASHE